MPFYGYGEVRDPPADAVRDLVLCEEIGALLASRRTLAGTTAIEAGGSV
jgi:hypothetical protein